MPIRDQLLQMKDSLLRGLLSNNSNGQWNNISLLEYRRACRFPVTIESSCSCPSSVSDDALLIKFSTENMRKLKTTSSSSIFLFLL